jgi:hypothetical protein
LSTILSFVFAKLFTESSINSEYCFCSPLHVSFGSSGVSAPLLCLLWLQLRFMVPCLRIISLETDQNS